MSPTSPPLSVVATAIREAMAASDRPACLMTDFDGTLAEIVTDPDAARILPAAETALRGLAANPAVQVAIVSGRSLADLRDRVGIDDVAYAGNHGLEIETRDRRYVHPEAERHRETVRDVTARVVERVGEVPGLAVEDKRLSATIHFREVTDEAAVARIEEAAAAVVADADGVRLRSGRQILEVLPAAEWGKGRAIEWLLSQVFPAGWSGRPVYLGDDVTDEEAFSTLGPDAVTVRIGEGAPETAARYRLATPAEVAEMLGEVNEAFG